MATEFFVDAVNVSIQFSFTVDGNGGSPIFYAENKMIQKLGVGVRHSPVKSERMKEFKVNVYIFSVTANAATAPACGFRGLALRATATAIRMSPLTRLFPARSEDNRLREILGEI